MRHGGLVAVLRARALADAPAEPVADAGRRESFVARTALVLVALAVVDDAFIHREPGTSVTDHLAGGLLPAAVAIALAAVYPRLRPGARAIVALTSGSLAIVAGVVDGCAMS